MQKKYNSKIIGHYRDDALAVFKNIIGQASEKIKNNYKLYLTTLTEKSFFTQFSTRTFAWLLLTFFKCLHNQLSSMHSIITYSRVQMFEKSDSSNRQ